MVATNILHGITVHLSSSGTDVPWYVAADNPDPFVVAAATDAARDETEGLWTPLADLLAAEGWHRAEVGHQHGTVKYAWTSLDGQRNAVRFSTKNDVPGAWLVSRPPTRHTPRRTQYVTSAYTPPAVLAAIALGDVFVP
ncbi:hypothetical protein KGQ19_01395 [Catenulispora sp. NL8]|uniref:DUF317 domain-containing protein n=1 Tax=Catenulispora pinistramenti TaxID=2705254 RepID=A0ABS5KHY6_9ACTN|nr:hypothetical protein [Catenulispora pinistramenti]MBS2545515.1 hypothetical protein [Catenulispora pinistramenti]